MSKVSLSASIVSSPAQKKVVVNIAWQAIGALIDVREKPSVQWTELLCVALEEITGQPIPDDIARGLEIAKEQSARARLQQPNS